MNGDDKIKGLLERSHTIAVVGVSNKPERDSHRVAAYLQRAGYRVIPVNPVVEEVLYPAMEDFALDIVIGKGPSARSIRLKLPRFTIVGATSGDTGSAAIDGVAGCDNVDIVILYPLGRTSDVQRRQMTTVDCRLW